MGLITETVTIKWHSRTKKYYIEKGYIFTKIGDEFEAKVGDLPKGSNTLVNIMCDCKECKSPYLKPMQWITYLKYIKKNDKYYCKKCLSKERLEHSLKTRLKNGLSFAQYLINMYGENALDLYWDYEQNILSPWEISSSSNKKVWIICQSKDKFYHGSYEIVCYSFVKGKRCSYCAGRKIHPKDSLGQLLADRGLLGIWSDKNDKSPYEYPPMSHKYAWYSCLDGKHEDYYRIINDSHTCEFRCPECVTEMVESILQNKVRLYLEDLNDSMYTILHEYNCTILPQNPKTKDKRGQLPFDNEIKELGLICEVMGKQHYQLGGYMKQLSKYNNTTPEYELHMLKVRDRYKKFISHKRGYDYIAIPYWTDNKDETWKKLINNKIKEIKNKEMVIYGI